MLRQIQVQNQKIYCLLIKKHKADRDQACKVAAQATQIRDTAKSLHTDKIEELLAEIKVLRNQVREQDTKIKYLEKITQGVKDISQKTQDRLNAFIAYGVDDNTKRLGAGERAAVLNSYKYAFNKL